MKAIVSLFVALACSLACKVATVRPIESGESGAAGGESFDAARYVESIWSTRVVPAVEDGATECGQLLEALRKDRDATLRSLGRGPRGRAHLLVKCEGVVVSVDRSSRAGLLGLDVAPRDGSPDVWLQAGPVLQGTALRDAVGFISFDDFVNQVEYADVGNALNQRVLDSVLDDVDAVSAKGTEVSFAGVLTPGERLIVTPVRLGRREG